MDAENYKKLSAQIFDFRKILDMRETNRKILFFYRKENDERLSNS